MNNLTLTNTDKSNATIVISHKEVDNKTDNIKNDRHCILYIKISKNLKFQ